jgi:hypothetical protein
MQAQDIDTFYLRIPMSKNDTIIYKRIIQYDIKDRLYHVRDYYPNGQIQMEGTYCSFDKNIKEESLWCNYRTNTKQGEFIEWYKDGQIMSKTNFLNGLRHGPIEYWYQNGQRGSSRGTDTIKLFCCGIPDQIWRKREFPFIIVAPQCPINQRWTTDNWFGNFFKEVTTKYRVDTNKVYLTGPSLGGEGTWYLAIKYPERFAAIAPMCGFTRNMDYIMKNSDKLIDIPVWAFHGKEDKTVQFEETEWMINRLKGENKNLHREAQRITQRH